MALERPGQEPEEKPKPAEQMVLPGFENYRVYGPTRLNHKTSGSGRVAPGHSLSIEIPTHHLDSALRGNQFLGALEIPMDQHWSGSLEYMRTRKWGEAEVFGIPEKTKGSDRPIYGYLRHHGGNPNNLELGRLDNFYGDTTVDLKPPKEDQKVTTTVGDSLNAWSEHAGEISRSEMRDYPEELESHHNATDDLMWNAPHWREDGPEYREVQWHDRPHPREDITRVHLSGTAHTHSIPASSVSYVRAHHEATAKQLREAGLPANVPIISNIHHTMVQPSLFEDYPDAIDPKYLKSESFRAIDQREV